MAERDVSSPQTGSEKSKTILGSEILARYLDWHFQLGKEPADRRKLLRDFLRDKLIPSIKNGETRSMAQDSKIVLGSYERQIEGTKNIPASGPLSVIANHWNEGPLGYWPNFLINEEVSEYRDENNEVRWTMQDGLTIGRSRWRVPFTACYQRMIARTYRHFLVPPPSVRAAGNDVVNESMEIFRSHKRGETLAFSPEAEGSTYLKNGHFLAGELAFGLLMARPDSMVCPVGVWTQKENGYEVLHVNFGEAFPLSDILIFGQKPKNAHDKKAFYGDIAHYLVTTINPFVPERYRLKNGRR